MKELFNFITLSLPIPARWRFQAAVCRTAARCLSGLVGTPDNPPTSAQLYFSVVPFSLWSAAIAFRAQADNDQVELANQARTIRDAFPEGLTRPIPPMGELDAYPGQKEAPQKEAL